MNSLNLTTEIRTLTEPTVARLGFDLVAVEWINDGRGAILRLSIDHENGVGADDCARVSHHCSQLLDEADPIDSSYRLEVSSPGIERPVQRARDFVRFRGLKVRVRLIEGYPRRRFTGVIDHVTGDRVTVLVDAQPVVFPVDAVERAHLVMSLEEFQQLADGAFPPVADDLSPSSEESP